MLYKEKTEKIIHAFYTVYNTLGYGFLEKVYHNALILELIKLDFKVRSQLPIKVYYQNQQVGDYYADIVVDDCIIIEIKAMEALRPEHTYQLINYLKATDIEVGLLINFGHKPVFERRLFTNDRKSLNLGSTKY